MPLSADRLTLWRLARPLVAALLLAVIAPAGSAASPPDPGEQLREAAEAGDLAAVKRLVEAGTDVDSPSRRKFTPLIVAVQHGHTAVVRYLLDRGADPTPKDYNARTALRHAEIAGHREMIPLLRVAVAGPETPELAVAALTGEVKHVEALLDAGADPDAANAAGDTALILAARADQAATVRILLARSADPNRENDAGATAVYEALGAGTAHRTGNCDVLRALLEAGADPNVQSSAGFSPLMLAATRGRLQCVGDLLTHGADPNLQTGTGYTALMYGLEHGLPMARLLVAAGADVDLGTPGGGNSVTGARSAELAAFVIQHSSDPKRAASRRREVRERALRNVAKQGRTDWLAKELDAGTDPNAVDDAGTSPLMLAAQAGGADVVRLLLERGAVPDHVDEDGRSALMLALEAGHVDAAAALLDAGAPAAQRSRDGESALSHAARGGHVKLARRLLAEGAPESLLEGTDASLVLPRETPQGRTLHVVNGPRPEIRWDGPLFVGYLGGLLLPIPCRRDSSKGPEDMWTDEVVRATHGLVTGDRVTALLDTGRVVSAKLGTLGCTAGECGGNFLHVALVPEGEALVERERVLAAGPLELFAPSEVAVSKTQLDDTPALLVSDARFGERILWTRSEGIGGPAYITVRMSRARSDGSRELGRAVAAGGQPCD